MKKLHIFKAKRALTSKIFITNNQIINMTQYRSFMEEGVGLLSHAAMDKSKPR